MCPESLQGGKPTFRKNTSHRFAGSTQRSASCPQQANKLVEDFADQNCLLDFPSTRINVTA